MKKLKIQYEVQLTESGELKSFGTKTTDELKEEYNSHKREFEHLYNLCKGNLVLVELVYILHKNNFHLIPMPANQKELELLIQQKTFRSWEFGNTDITDFNTINAKLVYVSDGIYTRHKDTNSDEILTSFVVVNGTSDFELIHPIYGRSKESFDTWFKMLEFYIPKGFKFYTREGKEIKL